MKRWLLWLAVAIVLACAATWTYGQYFSVPAEIKAAGSAFMRTAVTGDEAAIQRFLTPDSPMTSADIAVLYRSQTFEDV